MSKVKVVCENCGKEEFRYPSQVLKTVYCSRKCRSEFFDKHHTVKFKCDVCGKEKRQRKSSYESNENHFCSTDCLSKWKSESYKDKGNHFYGKSHSQISIEKISISRKKLNLTGENNPKYNRVTAKCDQCGKEVKKIPYLIKRNEKQFCSNDCHYAWNSENLIGEKSPTWNSELTDEDRKHQRDYASQRRWRDEVYKRDDFTCQICRSKENLHAHHLNSYHWDIENRTEVSNGVTLCAPCHYGFHSLYSTRNNNLLQFNQFKLYKLNQAPN